MDVVTRPSAAHSQCFSKSAFHLYFLWCILGKIRTDLQLCSAAVIRTTFYIKGGANNNWRALFIAARMPSVLARLRLPRCLPEVTTMTDEPVIPKFEETFLVSATRLVFKNYKPLYTPVAKVRPTALNQPGPWAALEKLMDQWCAFLDIREACARKKSNLYRDGKVETRKKQTWRCNVSVFSWSEPAMCQVRHEFSSFWIKAS